MNARPLVLVALLLAGCTEAAPLPAMLGDCDAGVKCGGGSSTVGGGGPTTGSGGGSDGGSCGLISFSPSACDTCMTQNCCDRNMACSSDSACLSLIDCENACPAGSTTCITGCRTQWQNGIAAHDNLVDCRDSRCTSECTAGDAGANCGDLTHRSVVCQDCISQSCCSQALACSNNVDCSALVVQCLFFCTPNDTSCLSGCQTRYPGASATYANLAACAQNACGGTCP